MIKMLLVGYLYGLKSERRLTEDVSLNLAYRWFCGFELTDKIPDHSLFSQNRRRRFTVSTIFKEIFNEILQQLIEKELVSGENMVSDGTFIPANVAWVNKVEIRRQIERSAISYLEELDEELENMKGYQKPSLGRREA